MIRGLFIRALCFLLRRFIPKYRAYNYEAQLALGILYRLKMYYAVQMLQQRIKQMNRADINKRRKKRGVKRKVKK